MTGATTAEGKTLLVIEASSHASLRNGLAELVTYRELVVFLTWRNVLVRYKQTALGAAWAILQPLFMMVVFTIFFGRLAGIAGKVHGTPYAVFAYAGLLPWTFFANSMTQASTSLVGNANLISKVYFPRLSLPLSAVLGALVDLAVAMSVLVVLMVAYSVSPNPLGLLALPLFVLLAFATALGVGTFLAAINVRFRDVQYTVPFLTQIWLFCTPVIYPASIFPEPWRTILAINPMTGVVEGFRWALLAGAPPSWIGIAISSCVAIAMLMLGIYRFRRTERRFADVI